MPKQEKEKLPRPKITIIPGRGVAQTINYLLEDRDDLEWIIAVGRTKNGELFSTTPAATSSRISGRSSI